jgi:hypothetical protein
MTVNCVNRVFEQVLAVRDQNPLRVLIRSEVLIRWLDQQAASTPCSSAH